MKIITENELYEMSNIRPKRTGLPMVIWIHESSGNERHFARIKVCKKYGENVNTDDGLFTITVPDKEVIGDTGDIKNRDIKILKEWIDLNTESIILFYTAKIDYADFLERIVYL